LTKGKKAIRKTNPCIGEYAPIAREKKKKQYVHNIAGSAGRLKKLRGGRRTGNAHGVPKGTLEKKTSLRGTYVAQIKE